MKNLLLIILLFASAGCLLPSQRPQDGQIGRRSLADTERLVREGKYQQAHDEYQRIAREAAGSPLREEALYRSARVLLASRNPKRDYVASVAELESYLLQYPSGIYAGDAADLIAALDSGRQARVQTLLENIAALEKRLEASANALRQAAADREGILKERDSLIAERESLAVRFAAAVAERDELLKKRSALLQEQNALVRDNRALKKRVEALKSENEKLLAAKEKLDKDLRDITAIDVKMEKERKKRK